MQKKVAGVGGNYIANSQNEERCPFSEETPNAHGRIIEPNSCWDGSC
jgi:hypothetical protein